MLKFVENFMFKVKALVLLLLAAFTIWMGLHATELRLDAGFLKQLPTNHPYVETFIDYREKLPGPNAVMVAVEAKEGTIWTPEFMRVLHDVTDDIFFLPGVFRGSVTSVWTPNTRVMQITEEGFLAYNLVPSDVTRDNIDDAAVEKIREDADRWGFKGKLFSNDSKAALIRFELQEIHPISREPLDYIDFAQRIESSIRAKYESDKVNIRIIGFAKMIGDIADGAGGVVWFFVISFLLTTAAVYFYCRSGILTSLAVGSSLVSVVWQFGLLNLLGYGLDPLAILVPFLVYAIGVSHGIQQINLISSEIVAGATAEGAARATFSRLLVPGSMALVTDLVGFATLYMIPVPMIQEMAIVASIGVALKIVSNLIMLPLVAAYFPVKANYAERAAKLRRGRVRLMAWLGQIARPFPAMLTLVLIGVLFVVAVYQSRGRHIGDVHPGAAELRADARYNLDSQFIVQNFAINLDAFVVVIETPENACIQWEMMKPVERFGLHLMNVDGVRSVMSLPEAAKLASTIWSEGSLKFKELPRNRFTLVLTTQGISTSSGLTDFNCNYLNVIAFTEDHKAETVKRVIKATEDWIAENGATFPDHKFRLATGNVGLIAATNQVIEGSETPMLLYVYGAIIFLVLLAYRDWRAVICCCAPLVVATFLGYWLMNWLEIGLKISTLPVLVLAVGIGVDYAFYIYSRLQVHLEAGLDIVEAFSLSMQETGMAVIFTGLTLSLGVSSWVFSDLKFQADMGLLLSFMFFANMVGAVTGLPALAATLYRLFPRKRTHVVAA
ncbi:MAG: MMPL family transporter [Parvibaculum sp.]